MNGYVELSGFLTHFENVSRLCRNAKIFFTVLQLAKKICLLVLLLTKEEINKFWLSKMAIYSLRLDELGIHARLYMHDLNSFVFISFGAQKVSV